MTTDAIPAGFEKLANGDELRIRYRSRGGALVVFLFLCLCFVLVTMAPYALSNWHQFKAMMLWLIWADWWTPLAFVASVVAVLYWFCFALWLSCGRIELVATRENLLVRKRLFGLQRGRRILRGDIQYFEQVKDGGGGEDSFPSWGLDLRAQKRIQLLVRQPIEKSDWLGPIMAEFYGVEFRPSAKRK